MAILLGAMTAPWYTGTGCLRVHGLQPAHDLLHDVALHGAVQQRPLLALGQRFALAVALVHLALYFCRRQQLAPRRRGDAKAQDHAQLDLGRYLARDWGATLHLDREFENGWRVGAFATKTSASGEAFDSGSFDKGIRLVVPLSWGLGQPSRSEYDVSVRSYGRDGGARLSVGGRLYDRVRGYQEDGVLQQWGRFWK